MRYKATTILIIILCINALYTKTFGNTKQYTDLYYEVINSDSSRVDKLEECYAHFRSTKDTTWITRSLIGLAEHEAKDGNYGRSFACLWESLLLAEEKKDIALLYKTHTRLSLLYNVFNKNEEAFEHEQEMLKYAKLGYQQGTLTGGALISAFYSRVLFYRKNGEYKKSIQALDSCNHYANLMHFSNDQKAYLIAEEGQVLLRQGKVNAALEVFKQSEETFKRINPGYLTIIYSYFGSAYDALSEWPKAELYYKKSIETVDIRHDHFDVKAESLGMLAHSLKQQNKFAEAYQALIEAKALNEEMFSAKGLQNRGLFDIRNMYQEEVEQRDRIIQERDNELILQKAENLRIKLILIGVISVIVILALFWYLRYSRRKLLSEKENQRITSELEKEKNKALVEMKNRELTSFTLQLIDKDSVINDIKESVKKHAPNNDKLHKAVKLETTGRLKLWDEFDKRFTGVNKGFYKKLKARFPDLTSTELKHCALIKLNFSAKEMAQLLNISINGVNTSRYRIRKKLGLEREENLALFIGQL